MSGRPIQKTANIQALQKLVQTESNVLDVRPIIAVTMRECGATFTEIASVFNISRQQAETITKNGQAKL